LFWALRIIDDVAYQKNSGRIIISLRRCRAAWRLRGKNGLFVCGWFLPCFLSAALRGLIGIETTAYVTTGIKSGKSKMLASRSNIHQPIFRPVYYPHEKQLNSIYFSAE